MTDLQSIRTTRKIVRQELLEHFSDQEIEAEHSRRVLRKFDAWTVIGRRDSHWKSQGSHKIDCPQMSRKKSHARNAANLCRPQKPFAYRDRFKATYQFDVAVCLRRETERVRTSVPAEHFPVIQPQRSAIKQYIRRVFDRHPFLFDDVSASFNGYQRILDFKNRTSDSGLYDRSGSLQLFATGGSDDPHAGTTGHVFSNGMLAELLVTRNASSFFSALVIGQGDFSVTDMNGATRFSGPDNIIYFFMHDFVSLTNFPDRPEAGTGFIDRIQVTTFPAEVPASPGVDFLASSSWRALAFSAGGDGGRN
jgi:hypothetical protein